MKPPRSVASPAGARPSRRRRRVLLLLYPLYLLALVEAASFAALWKVRGGAPSLGWARALQVAQAEADVRGTAPLKRHASRSFVRREVQHPYLGFLPFEDADQAGDDVVWPNQERFYTPDSPLHSDEPGLVVIGITGGSVAKHFAQLGRGTLAAELARHPRFEGRSLRFAVMAFGGFKQPQQLMALSYVLALGGRLDLLINLDGFNEVALHAADNAQQGVSPAFPRGWFFRTYADEVLAPQLGELDHLALRRATLAQDAIRSPLRFSWTFDLLWWLRDRRLERTQRAIESRLWSYRPETDTLRLGPQLATEDPATRRALVELWSESSRQLARLCEVNDIEYFHLLQPNQYVEGSKPLSAEERASAFKPDHRYGRAVPEAYPLLCAAGAGLAEEGIRFADLTQIFAATEETLYVDNCCHLNELGNELMARAIAEFVLSHTE